VSQTPQRKLYLIHALVAGYLFSIRLLLTSSGIYTSAPAGRLLLIPNIASRAALLISPILTTLVAFKLGAEWMRAVESLDDRIEEDTEGDRTDMAHDARPSALQVSPAITD
jgi:hypothetical protein